MNSKRINWWEKSIKENFTGHWDDLYEFWLRWMRSFCPLSRLFLFFCGNFSEPAHFLIGPLSRPFEPLSWSVLPFSWRFDIICTVRKSFNWLNFFDLPFGVLRCLYASNINQNNSDKFDNNLNLAMLKTVAMIKKSCYVGQILLKGIAHSLFEL